MLQGNPNHGDYSAAAPFVKKGPLLTLTIKGRPHVLTHEEIQQITFPQFAALYTVSCFVHHQLLFTLQIALYTASCNPPLPPPL